MSISIEDKDLDGSPQKIGTLYTKPVYQLKTKGGFYMIVTKKNDSNKPEVLGTGNHRAVARHIASKKFQDLVYTELSKSDHVNIEHYAHFIPEYEAITDYIRKINGDE